MKSRLGFKQAFAVYSIVFVFIAVFYVLGLFLGKNHFVGLTAGAEELSSLPETPVSDIKNQLEFYQRVMQPAPHQSNKDTTAVSGQRSAVSDQRPAVSGQRPAVSGQPPQPKDPVQIRYTVQVGAMKVTEEARQLLIRLETKGYAATLQPPGGDQYYRVRVGEFATREEALETEAALKGDGFATYVTLLESP
ncbi:MAG: SPOR domain-containing protein [Acidobacteriota bacterium]